MNETFWKAETIGQLFGDINSNVEVIGQNRKKKMNLQDYFKGLSNKEEQEKVKISDFPEKEPGLRLMVPEIVDEFFSALPFKRYMHPSGPMNMVIFLFAIR